MADLVQRFGWALSKTSPVLLQWKDCGPFIVESDLAGNSLFERENAKIAANLDAAYEGTKPAVLKRFGETDDRGDELI